MKNTGKTVVINYDTLCVQFKRGCDIESDSKNPKRSRDIPNVLTISSTPPDSELHVPDSDLPVPDSEIIELNKLLPDVISALKEMGREQDFVSVLRNIADRKITRNVALHLLLDVGQFLRQETVHGMRYSEVTKDFWTLVQKMFKGKGVRFFLGIKRNWSKH